MRRNVWTFHDAPTPRSKLRWVGLIALPVTAFVAALFAIGADTQYDWPWWVWFLAAVMFLAAILEGFLRHVSRG